MKKLGVNIDHVATLRNVRLGKAPDPIALALLCKKAGADNITFHLREDRRHIKDQDVLNLKEKISIGLNFEMACTNEMVQLAQKIQPEVVTFVPEKREELTTEGGLDLSFATKELQENTRTLVDQGIDVSYFIEPDGSTILQAKEMGATSVEIHTGRYAHLFEVHQHQEELEKIATACEKASSLGLHVHAGHGLNLANLPLLVSIETLGSFQIGHAIVSDALIHGIENTITLYKRCLGA